MNNIPSTIKWRGSVYNLENVENGTVYWYNPVSRHHDKCSVESWKAGIPYEHLAQTMIKFRMFQWLTSSPIADTIAVVAGLILLCVIRYATQN